MTMHDHHEWTDQLSDYLDAELPDQEQRAVSAHVAECAECANTLDDLRAITARAAALQPAEPSANLWSGIAGRIATTAAGRPITGRFGRWRRVSLTWPELVAASVLLMFVSGLTVLRFVSTRPPATRAEVQTLDATSRTTAIPVRADVVAASLDDQEYDAAVADLQRALQSGRSQLDAATVKIVEDNLTIIDQAVDDARRALAADPANADLSGYFLHTRQRKLDLLRRAAALTELN
jgi:anti-sigma factor RsiW